MASGEQAQEVNHLKAAYAKADNLQTNANAVNPVVPVCPHISMAEAIAVAAAIELVLTIRNMLLNVKTNVRATQNGALGTATHLNLRTAAQQVRPPGAAAGDAGADLASRPGASRRRPSEPNGR
jgi:hypothetical protein